ncbi:hypothetical protein [Pedobacter sp. SL55]|uniref:ISAon1 family transposase N-terminal region protein n=1 Tax=Pedobacter sp. SL55 TaxID=2995161 RepID=UPI00226E7D5C|nr:hypothetical protein [Pedobacter sp. SL55]WAC38959.1 hypothetical protein OVA16_10050 [Pedobacter sp. SL55]WAC39384.1 hypothetical protein OVA16_12310 [Pedobacter sp. SL55]WAC41079.1 hypothetical protein OVA16_01495 [Pedobacter sp. SL55]
MEQQELLKLLLPTELIEHFDLIRIEPMEDGYHLFLDQHNIPPAEFASHKLESKGFLDQAIIRDFPLRGKACFLHLRRRKWHDHDTGRIRLQFMEYGGRGHAFNRRVRCFFKRI